MLYGWLSKLWSLFGSFLCLGYPKRDHKFDNHPYRSMKPYTSAFRLKALEVEGYKLQFYGLEVRVLGLRVGVWGSRV